MMGRSVSISQESIDKLARAIAREMQHPGCHTECASATEAPPDSLSEKLGKNESPDLVALSGIADILVQAAKAHDQSVTPERSAEACKKALADVKLTKEERAALEGFIPMPTFQIFARAWQKWHDQTSKEVFGR